tara:strand:- start:487 stop:729 length:243 start_codon:yes stop_codon:yes gene_type:complete
MNTSGPEGWEESSDYFVISYDKDSDISDFTDSDSDTETESESSSSGYLSNKEEKPIMLKGYMKNTKKYKKILFEDTIFPE